MTRAAGRGGVTEARTIDDGCADGEMWTALGSATHRTELSESKRESLGTLQCLGQAVACARQPFLTWDLVGGR